MAGFVVVRPSRALLGVVAFALAWLAMVFAILLSVLGGEGAIDAFGLVVLSFFTLVPVVISVVAARTYVWGSRVLRRASELVAGVGDGGEVLFSRPVTVTPGRLVVAQWRSGRSTHVHWEFRGSGAPMAASRLEWEDVDRSGVVVAETGMSYVVVLPAYRVEDQCCRGVFFALVEPGASYCLSEASLAVCSSEGDCATAHMECSGPGGVRAEVVYNPGAGKAREARLEVRARLATSAASFTGRRVVVASRGGPAEALVSLALPAERKVLLLAHRASPVPAIYREAGGLRVEGFAGVAPEPEYRARLVLDIPLARDVAAETPLDKHPVQTQV